MIPIVFLLLLMLAQPAILLYNKMVMENAAAEGCRLLATKTSFGAYGEDKYEGYIRRRLASVPPLDIFHASPSGKGWQIEMIGDESSATVTVRITNYVRPLPLIGLGAALLGQLEGGYLVQTVEVTMPSQPDWVWTNPNGGPSSWPMQWED